ncbi:hypothetical protein [Dyadobacter arcticus]|uniref:DUF642 domain-containing protein n=1 Tax=Dyadobacter arcticus TaxID=1078754 RepID=A0ABX0UUP8_9BACT|nr:hypothetical protein [Dyadobacter arcticus]NIJ55530.1 hypothetical protein [Dyadobacter arcticus]
MEIVQKLPAALAVACLMMLSSCSNDDALAPEPKVESVNTNSNLKVDVVVAPSIFSTQWYTGIDILPSNWSRNVDGYSNDVVAYPVGISSVRNLWGDPSRPFVQELILVPWARNITTFITVKGASSWDTKKMSSVKTKIRNLKPGKKYALTVYVSSSIPKATYGVINASFAKKCLIKLGNTVASQEEVVDLTSYKNCWVQKIITFTASGSEMDFAFSTSIDQYSAYAYAHLLVGDNALKQLN